jgi:hypothetical protein
MRLVVVLKTGEKLAYSDAEVEERPGSYRVRITREGVLLDSLNALDVDRWFRESCSSR